VAAAPAGTRYVVLTHDHALDYELCRVILSRADAAWLGLIGSASKSARFRSRLLRDGLDREALAGLTCPIGVPNIPSKLPGAIAIAIAAQLLQRDTRELATNRDPVPPQAATTLAQECSGSCRSCEAERRHTL
jgi:xanthine dehydrogenase accessory factor